MNSETAAVTTEKMRRRQNRLTYKDCIHFIIFCCGTYIMKCLRRADYEVPDEEKLKADPQYGTSMAILETDTITADEQFVKLGDVIGVSREGVPIRVMD